MVLHIVVSFMLDLIKMNNLTVNVDILKKSLLKGLLAFSILLSVYFLIITLISGWKFAWDQFAQFWYYVISLALGFGVQVTLYSYLKGAIKQQATGQVLATTGTTSTATMISCCAHYLTNILPILGVTGIITFIGQYQVQFFWIGLFFNLLGIFYIGSKVLKLSQQ
ncbi:MAG: hypothetical protein UT77_C0001G0249 [Candidatus Daviesbacteria bacterium GW2011_GWC2_40_12]|uniref:Uncharacterized protein n=1 Tax=Candidatus Daviesbacteria bacterium GW2011_GWC2_40_12 TaxID=1618431 RepID=A0A0G0QRM6_9BACT|nr:MAG: hypothetical protein UT04_C0073G0004 [Candidatus Daviesbacteria bacterium GW2011_GWF2_38_7]KKR17420.1 MAG: hypothetical protein UT45_C0001G0095 [Candidatus Daviesbacteria bacterium GW2011_GWA2_39_33]KKR42798.1 MAG: hypothetical protein UT77_C0001G0249 [Candidatus Daviesbacteria bacterium GW2011_GWC2_40_12]